MGPKKNQSLLSQIFHPQFLAGMKRSLQDRLADGIVQYLLAVVLLLLVSLVFYFFQRFISIYPNDWNPLLSGKSELRGILNRFLPTSIVFSTLKIANITIYRSSSITESQLIVDLSKNKDDSQEFLLAEFDYPDSLYHSIARLKKLALNHRGKFYIIRHQQLIEYKLEYANERAVIDAIIAINAVNKATLLEDWQSKSSDYPLSIYATNLYRQTYTGTEENLPYDEKLQKLEEIEGQYLARIRRSQCLLIFRSVINNKSPPLLILDDLFLNDFRINYHRHGFLQILESSGYDRMEVIYQMLDYFGYEKTFTILGKGSISFPEYVKFLKKSFPQLNVVFKVATGEKVTTKQKEASIVKIGTGEPLVTIEIINNRMKISQSNPLEDAKYYTSFVNIPTIEIH